MFEPTNAYLWQQKAMPFFKQKKYELGLQYLDSAIKYDQTNYEDYPYQIKRDWLTYELEILKKKLG